MGTAIKLLASALIYTCVATVLSQGAVVAYLCTQGTLNRHKCRQIAAVLAGAEIATPQAKPGPQAIEPSQQVSLEEVLERRVAKSLDLNLREQAVEKGLADLRTLAAQVAEDTRQLDSRRTAFQASLDQLAKDAQEAGITEVRRTLEALRPRQAKDQLLQMLRVGDMPAVVTMIKAMPLEKRKKLLAEFKDADEPDKLAEILRQILEGKPEAPVIQQAQQGLTALQP
jgi:hypothetical protein